MTIPNHIAVIDIGKTNAKVVLIDRRTQGQLASRSMPNAVAAGGLYPHADVDGLWAFITRSLASMRSPTMSAIL